MHYIGALSKQIKLLLMFFTVAYTFETIPLVVCDFGKIISISFQYYQQI